MTIDVCAALVLRGDRLLLATRKPNGHLAGKWEFPGGKIKDGESPERCIARELEEELGLEIQEARELFLLPFDYPEKSVRLHFMLCKASAEAHAIPLEGQKCGWFRAAEASALDLAPADERAIDLMRGAVDGKVPEGCEALLGDSGKDLRDFWSIAVHRAPERLPEWLHISFSGISNGMKVQSLIRHGGLHTVCESANCPNKCDCWKRKTATFMILGGTCTRFCRFCSVNHGKPEDVDPDEAEKIADSVMELGLKYAVITCVTRDDLPDGGSSAMADVVRAIRRRSDAIRVEVLCSDYAGDLSCVDRVLEAGPAVFGHNVETVERLTPAIRNKADYRRSLDVLAHAAGRGALVKSGIMLGLGETDEEIALTLADLKRAGVQIVTLGQYLRPTRKHWPVARYVTPQEFESWQIRGEKEFGFRKVVAGPFVRSSYLAEEAFANSH